MDKRSKKILNYLVYHSQKDSRALINEFGLTRNQLNYSIKKINEWCQDKHLSEIKRMRNGYFYLADDLIYFFKKEETEAGISDTVVYSYTEKDRGQLMLLLIFTKTDYLSLDHFMIDLDISKNTAVRSLSYLRDQLPENIQLDYSRSAGYDLIGNEWDLRKLLIKVVTNLYKIPDGPGLLKHFIRSLEQAIANIHSILEKAENSLNVKFSDDRMETLPYFLAIVTSRIQRGNIIQESFQIDNTMLADTKEYAVVSEMLENWEEIPDQEKLYITLQLLSINVVSGEILTEELTDQLSQIVDECLVNFEKKACIALNDKKDLKERMVLHLKPAFYRIRYHLNLKMKVEDIQMDPKYYGFKEIIRESFEPLQTFIGEKIPDEEFTFIAFFVLSALSEEKRVRNSYKAVVVCKSGVLISQTLNTFLQKIFPEFTFLTPSSLRSFPKYKEEVDVVFSTVPIKGVENLFIVKPIMSQLELEVLKSHVLNELEGSYHYDPQVTVEKIMEIVEQNATLVNRESIEKNLAQLFQQKENTGSFTQWKEISLFDLLTVENVKIVKKTADYQEATQLASQPLLEKGQITNHYVQAMIEAHDMEEAYIILGSDIVIPHARPEDGVKELACSLLYVKEGVRFSKDALIHFVFVVAPVNQESHIPSLFEIMSIAEDLTILNKMKGSSTPQDLLNNMKVEKVDR